MMKEDSNGRHPQKEGGSLVPSRIDLAPSMAMDISWLPENERQELLASYFTGRLDIANKAQELHVDATALRTILDNLAATTKEVSESGNAITVSHAQTTSVGRTEIVMGNTQQAQSGKLSKSQTGETDWTPLYILGAIVAVIIIVAMISAK